MDIDTIRKNWATDKSLKCDICKKQPLLKKTDVVPSGLVSFQGGLTPELMKTHWNGHDYSILELQTILDQVIDHRATKCSYCGRILCVGCLKQYGKYIGSGKGCDKCGSKMEILI